MSVVAPKYQSNISRLAQYKLYILKRKVGDAQDILIGFFITNQHMFLPPNFPKLQEFFSPSLFTENVGFFRNKTYILLNDWYP